MAHVRIGVKLLEMNVAVLVWLDQEGVDNDGGKLF